MSEVEKSSPRKIPEEELKFGLSLRAELFFSPDEPVDVVIAGAEDLEEDRLFEVVSSSFKDSSLRRVVDTMLAATVSPPDIRSKLIKIAANNEVTEIILDEPLMIPTIQKPYFH